MLIKYITDKYYTTISSIQRKKNIFLSLQTFTPTAYVQNYMKSGNRTSKRYFGLQERLFIDLKLFLYTKEMEIV